MKRILVLGGTGLLGNAVVRYFTGQKGYDVTATYRTEGLDIPCNKLKFDALNDSPAVLSGSYDYAINCIGIIKPFIMQDIVAAIKINSMFPHTLTRWCIKEQIKLIHITSDCVFSGQKGKYVESDNHDAYDEYGKTKSLGEPVKNSMVLRTSIIGEEIHKYASLLSWAKSQKGNTIPGYSTHIWNGVTTDYYAKICDTIIKKDLFEPGLFHVFAKDDVTKMEMMFMFNEKYSLGLKIKDTDPGKCDRTLRTEKELNKKLKIPTVKQMIEEL